IDWHKHRTKLRNGVERLQLRMRVGCDVRDAIAVPNSELVLEYLRPPIAAIEELVVGKTEVTVNHCFTLSIQSARPSREFHGCQCEFHWLNVPPLRETHS